MIASFMSLFLLEQEPAHAQRHQPVFFDDVLMPYSQGP